MPVKLHQELQMPLLSPSRPARPVKLDPIGPEQLPLDLALLRKWSPNNPELYSLLLQNGMAEHICNLQFLHQFYRELIFMYSSIEVLDVVGVKLRNLLVLNLVGNKLRVLQNVGAGLRELYLDYNQIDRVDMKERMKLEVLSISHNRVDSVLLGQIVDKIPELRCLNVGYNRVEDLRQFVKDIKEKCQKVKVLIGRNNPMAMLGFYWEYVTEELKLDYIDNQKYVKPVVAVVEKVPEVKEQKKQEKKDTKKETKKPGNKVEQKPIEQSKKPEPLPPARKVRTDSDFQSTTLRLHIATLENLSGTIYDPSLFPQQNLNIKQTQSCFWVRVESSDLLTRPYSTEDNKIYMDSLVAEGDVYRLSFDLLIEEKLPIEYGVYERSLGGVMVRVFREEPLVELDADSGEQRVILIDAGSSGKAIKMKVQCIGGVYIDIEQLWGLNNKTIALNYPLFQQSALSQPLFRSPYQNQAELISKHRPEFDAKLATFQQQLRQRALQEQIARAQKKAGGKDGKKAPPPAKKQGKKDAKEQVAERKPVPRSELPKHGKQYRYLGEGSMYKARPEYLAITVSATQ